MQFLKNIKLIQGGMGVYISHWRLAKAVAMNRPGETAGTISGTGLDVVHARLLQLGDPGGHVRRALNAFDKKFETDIGQKICDRYFIEGGKAPDARYKRTPIPILRSQNGRNTFPAPNGDPDPVHLKPNDDYIELLIATGFVETWLAKEGHSGPIFINFLKKVEIPLMYLLYGAMLAEIDGVIIGAGNPDGLPALCSHLTHHEEVSYHPSVMYRDGREEVKIIFDPKRVAGGIFTKEPLKRPAFLAIVSQENLAQALAESASQAPDGLIIEHHTAGGHNANPNGPMKKDHLGQPIYSEKDEADLEAIRKLGLPFWLAGGYGNNEKLKEALAAGATGIQVGSVFALAEESGMKPEYRAAFLKKLRNGSDDASLVMTSMFSPTGFSFKVAQLEGTLSETQVFENRHRVCDIGFLYQLGFSKPDENGMRKLFHRCPAGPIDSFVNKRGLARNTDERRCLCNGLYSAAGLGQVIQNSNGKISEEPAIVTMGNNLQDVRQLSRQGQTPYWVSDAVEYICG